MTGEHFRERPDRQLQALSDEDLVAYIRAAHGAGRAGAGRRGLAILVYGHWERIKFRVARKVPAWEVEDVTATVIESAIGASFGGGSVGELHGFLNTITKRRIADHTRDRRVRLERLPDRDQEDAPFGDEAADDAEVGAVELRMVVDELVAELRPEHQRVVELYCIERRPAAEVAGQVEGMTEDNVHQIASRFRARLREALDDGDTSR